MKPKRKSPPPDLKPFDSLTKSEFALLVTDSGQNFAVKIKAVADIADHQMWGADEMFALDAAVTPLSDHEIEMMPSLYQQKIRELRAEVEFLKSSLRLALLGEKK